MTAALGGNDLYQLVYTSRADAPFGEDALLSLLARARRHNAMRGVTGVLMVHDGFFAQCLEGPRAEVETLFGRICRDGRHHSVVVVLEQDVLERSFGEWFMGYTKLTDSDILRLSTARWERSGQRRSGAGTCSPGLILLQTLWDEHRQVAVS